MIEPVDDSRPLSDRFIDRLLGWWDVGGGRRMRRAVRAAAAASSARIRTSVAPLMARPVIARSVATVLAGFAATRRCIGKAFAYDAPATHTTRTPVATKVPAKVSAANTVELTPPRPASVTKPATAEIRTHRRSATGEIPASARPATTPLRSHIRSGTNEIKPPTAPSLSTPAMSQESPAEAPPTAMTSTLRCWSCLQRNRVRLPRRGGCFLCVGCNVTMLVVDPVVGLTCDVAQAQAKGITLSRQADETDPG